MAAATRREVEPDGTSAHGRVPWWARVFAYGFVALLLVSGSQFTLFAMWFDMETNKELR